jgi:membrane-associated phospholipid phosphatase
MPPPDADPTGRSRLWLIASLVLLLAVVVLATLQVDRPQPDPVPADLAAALEVDPELARYDGQLARAADLQDRAAWLTPVMEVVTFLGDEEFYLLMLPLVYWAISRRFGIRLGAMLLLTASVNGILKLVFATPRPSFLVPEVEGVTETSFGLPSGHAQNAAAIWGLLAISVRRWWLRIVLVALVAMIGWSRIHLGVHFQEDMLVGWLVGALLVVAFVALEGPLSRWWLGLPMSERMLAAVVASLALIAPATLLAAGLADVSFPWPGLPDPLVATGASHVVTPAATLAGFGIGLAMLLDRGGFDHRGPIGRRVLRVLVGLIGVAVLWQGLGVLFPGGESLGALGLRYLRYALVGAWVGGLAPLLFVRFGLAAPAPEGALVAEPVAGTTGRSST